MTDTSPEFTALVRARLVARSGTERFLMGVRMHEAARRMVIASLPATLPPEQFRDQLRRRMYSELTASPPTQHHHHNAGPSSDFPGHVQHNGGRPTPLQIPSSVSAHSNAPTLTRRNRSGAQIARCRPPAGQTKRWKFSPTHPRRNSWNRSFMDAAPPTLAHLHLANKQPSNESSSMKITGNGRKHADEKALSEEGAKSRGMGEKSKEFFGSGAVTICHSLTLNSST
jgi:hypothetical protein